MTLQHLVWRAPLAMLALVGFMVACGGDESTSSPPTQAASTQADKPAPKKPFRPHAKPPVEGPSAGEALREVIELPDFYPEDAPIYPGSKPAKARTNPSNAATLMFGTPDSPEQVSEFMRDEIVAKGWELMWEKPMTTGSMIQARKGERGLTILTSILDQNKDSEITLIAITVAR